MKLSDFDYDLPSDLIAQNAAPRGESRLLMLDRKAGTLRHGHIRELPPVLQPGDLLVVNDTRVFPARLLGHRVPTAGAVECLLLAREDTEDGVGTPGQIWSALMHPGQKLKPGARVRFEGSNRVLLGEVLERHFFGRRRIRLWVEGDDSIDAVIDAIGHMPLPPYIHRPDTIEDRDRYQTVFAAHRGSVAAPTAGLHFDDELLRELDRAGVQRTNITLHVGYGTFKPVRSENVDDHVVDREPYRISEEAAGAINRARSEHRRIIAVGTTTTRALEDAARGDDRVVRAGTRDATIFIRPGFEFRVIDGLLTNFHLPKSSLLMLVCAFAGRERILETYREAVAHRYRFYSYGDAMLIL